MRACFLVSQNAFGLSVKIVDISMYHLSCKTWFYGAVKKLAELSLDGVEVSPVVKVTPCLLS